MEHMPVAATNKIRRAAQRREGFRCADPVWCRPQGEAGEAGAFGYRRLTEEDVARLTAECRAHGRLGRLQR